MFLKRLKEKSNRKFINKILASKKTIVSNKPLESIGVVFNFDEFYNDETFKLLLKSLGIKENNVKTITFVADEKKSEISSWDMCFTSKDFGWNGKVNSVDLNQFINTKFDALISYYTQDNLPLNLITVASKANFKIGISSKNIKLNDFTIEVKPKDTEIFKTELIKYLKVLNKI